MDKETKLRATHALLEQNGKEYPSPYTQFKHAYIVGKHIWLAGHCAVEWKDETNDLNPIESLSYKDAWEYAKYHNLI